MPRFSWRRFHASVPTFLNKLFLPGVDTIQGDFLFFFIFRLKRRGGKTRENDSCLLLEKNSANIKHYFRRKLQQFSNKKHLSFSETLQKKKKTNEPDKQ